jgi:hypothetical protein
MPNWCDNYITVKHSDPAMITRMVDAYNKDQLLEEFYPLDSITEDDLPESVKKLLTCIPFQDLFDPKCRLDRASYGWGTKWDTGRSHGREPRINKDGKTVRFNCYTAWNPPIGVFKKWQTLGFEVHCRFNEPGMQLKGTWPAK